MKKWLFTFGILLACSDIHLTQAQSLRAVRFVNNTYIYGAVFGDSPTLSSEFMVSYMYTSDTKKTGTIVATYPSYSSSKIGYMIQHYWDVATQTMRMLFQVESNSTPRQVILRVSETPMPYSNDGAWHHVTIYGSTQTGNIVYALDAGIQPWDTSKSVDIGLPFVFTAYGSKYQIGADLDANLQATDFYKGGLAEVFAYVQDDAASRISTPGGIRQGTAVLRIDPNTGLGRLSPLQMGPNCAFVYGPEKIPDLCLRGGAAAFRYNTWNTFIQVGTLVDAGTSPWSALQ